VEPGSEHKQWAKQHYAGIENLLLPSFSPNFAELDEAGIRYDVRQSIRQGFFATMCARFNGSLDEYKRVVEIACDEADGRIQVGVNAGRPTVAESVELLAHGKRVGCTHAFVAVRTKVASEDQLYAAYRTIIEQSKLPVVLYAFRSPGACHLHPSGVPIDVYSRLADLPNVVAVKLTQTLDAVTALQLCERVAGRLLVGPADLSIIPLLARQFPIQWSGQWTVDAVQSPEKPYAVELITAVRRGNWSAAYKAYWALEPAYRAFSELQAPLLRKGSHPWAHMKFHQWVVGGNGGLIREPRELEAVLDAAGRSGIREACRSIGITPYDGPDEEFLVGRTNFAKGIRSSDLSAAPWYSPM
jgi:4-hydroxy-tetrahydrodipicolinate synthase